MTSSFSPIAFAGFSAAEAYDTHRPSYIKPAVDDLLAHLGISGVRRAKILDLAAGTGKFTELLAARDEEYQILAVEPHTSMLAKLQEKRLRGVEAREGDALRMPVADGWADAVVAAQAFHWFSTHDALSSIAATLRPGGKFGLIWNVEDYNQAREYPTKTQWESDLRAINWKYTTDTSPRYKDLAWAAAFEGQTVFSPIEERIFEVSIWLEKEDLWKRLGTLSNITNLSDGEKDDLREEFDEVLEIGQDIERNEKGEIAVHYIVHTAWATKL